MELVGAAPVDEGHLVCARVRHGDLNREGRAAVPLVIRREVVRHLVGVRVRVRVRVRARVRVRVRVRAPA